MSFKTRAEVTNYAEAEAFLGNRESRDIAYATKVERMAPNSIAIKHHDTHIVRYHKGGLTLVHNGGHETRTTKERIERFTPVRIDGSCESGYTGHRPKNFREWEVVFPGGRREPYRNGMAVSYTTIIPDEPEPVVQAKYDESIEVDLMLSEDPEASCRG